MEESTLLEQQSQRTPRLEAACADEGSNGSVPCAVRDQRRGLISKQDASCHNSWLRQNCRSACTGHTANTRLQRCRSLRPGTPHGTAACRALPNRGRFFERTRDVYGRVTRCCSYHDAAAEPFPPGKTVSPSWQRRCTLKSRLLSRLLKRRNCLSLPTIST